MFFGRNLMSTANPFRNELTDLFNTVRESWPVGRTVSPHLYPAINMWEDDNALYAEAEVPGMSMDDLELTVVGNELTIKGQRKSMDGENLSYRRQERNASEFTRMIALPFDIDADKVDAKLKDGVLLISLPKAEKARPRKIIVKSN